MNFSHWVMNEPALNRAVCHSLNWSLIEWSNAGTFHSVSFSNQIQFGLVWNLRLTNFNFFPNQTCFGLENPTHSLSNPSPIVSYPCHYYSLIQLTIWQLNFEVNAKSVMMTVWWRFGSWSLVIKLIFCSDFEHKVCHKSKRHNGRLARCSLVQTFPVSRL